MSRYSTRRATGTQIPLTEVEHERRKDIELQANRKLQRKIEILKELENEEKRLESLEEEGPNILVNLKNTVTLDDIVDSINPDSTDYKTISIDIFEPNQVYTKLNEIFNRLYPNQHIIDTYLQNCSDSSCRTRKLRQLYDRLTASQQCTKTGNSFKSGMACWLCGGKMYTLETAKKMKNPGLRGICDHILPVIQATFFLGIYTSETKNEVISELKQELGRNPNANEINDRVKNKYGIAYAWAHNSCNSSKSGMVFITADGKGNIKPDIEVIKQCLKNIFKMNHWGDENQCESWANNRIPEIVSRIQPITDRYNISSEQISTNALLGAANLIDRGQEHVIKQLGLGRRKTMRKNHKKTRKNRKHK